jgi:hypothetical protein
MPVFFLAPMAGTETMLKSHSLYCRSDGRPVPAAHCSALPFPWEVRVSCHLDCPLDCLLTPWSPWDASQCQCGTLLANLTRTKYDELVHLLCYINSSDIYSHLLPVLYLTLLHLPPSDSTVSEDAGIAILELAVRSSNHSTSYHRRVCP